MKTALLGVLEKSIDFLPKSQLTALASSLEFNDSELEIFYGLLRRTGAQEALVILHEREDVRSRFTFLGELYPHWVSEERFDLLPYPRFSVRERTLHMAVKAFFPYRCSFSKRVIDEKTRIYGVVFLNNLNALLRIFGSAIYQERLDQVYALDHSKELPHWASDLARPYQLLTEHYSMKRFFRLLLSLEQDHASDVRTMLSELSALPAENRKLILPRKPRTMRELHDVLSRELLKRKQDPTVELNQQISHLHGKVIDGYTVEVPQTSGDLQETSADLSHCVHTYVARVVGGHSQILNLRKDGKRTYTLELQAVNGNFTVKQFKGLRNENSMEGIAGQFLRQRILDLINESPTPRAST